MAEQEAAKSIDIGELTHDVCEAFCEEFEPEAETEGEGEDGMVAMNQASVHKLWPIQILDDALIVQAPEDTLYRVPYAVNRQAVEGDPAGQEIVTGFTFSPRQDWVKVMRTFVEVKAIDQADGRVRWLAVSSGGFQDRDGEIVSTAFLESAVKAADTTGQRGTLDIWHIPGTDIGGCDYQTVANGFLIESGLFDDTEAGLRVAVALKENGDQYGVSIQFVHTGIAPGGVYMPPGAILRRSILPKDAAAFPWSGIALKELADMAVQIDDKKRAELVALVGEEIANVMLAAVDGNAQKLKELGVRFKEIAVAPMEGVAVEGVTLEATSAIYDVELTDTAAASIAEKAVADLLPAVRNMLTAALADQKDLHAAVKQMSADVGKLTVDVAEMRRDEDARIAEKAAGGLSRAQMRMIRRPTQVNVKEEAPQTQGDGKAFADRAAAIFQ